MQNKNPGDIISGAYDVRDRIRTHDLLVRSQTLYPAELRTLAKRKEYHSKASFSCQALLLNLIHCTVSLQDSGNLCKRYDTITELCTRACQLL